MTPSEQSTPQGDPHRVQLRAAHGWTIADLEQTRPPSGVDRLYLMVTAVFDRLTERDEPVRSADV